MLNQEKAWLPESELNFWTFNAIYSRRQMFVHIYIEFDCTNFIKQGKIIITQYVAWGVWEITW